MIKKLNEFFDSDEIKNNKKITDDDLKNMVKNAEDNNIFLNFFAILTYKYPFFKDAKQDKLNNFTSEFTFSNDEFKIIVTFIKNYETYDVIITYLPIHIFIPPKNIIQVNGEYFKIEKNKYVNQRFSNLNINDVYEIIDNVFIPLTFELDININLNMNTIFNIDKN